MGENINDTFFSGRYKDIWRMLIPEELTVKEVDFMLSFFNLGKESKVLDLMCGYGRHALSLARKGVSVVAIDNLADYISEIVEIADKEELPVKAIQGDLLKYRTNESFDLAICMGNSLNFFNAVDCTTILTNVYAHLKPGGQVFINSWSLAEITFKNFKERGWGTIGDIKMLTDSRILFYPTRMETVCTMIAPDGPEEVKTGIDYIFSINELENMFREAGLVMKEIYSIPGKKKFLLGDPRAYIIAEKPLS